MPLLVWPMCALAGQVLAVFLARLEHRGTAEVLSFASLALMYGSVVWVLTRPNLTRAARNTAVICLAVTPALMLRATNPLLLNSFDQQLHMRTLADIISSHGLFQDNPLLTISPRYPGLEAVTVLLDQLGIPTVIAAITVILVSRIVLVTVLCDAVEQLTESRRAGGLAVAVYAVSPQFVWFNSQFSYQTLALPLALAAVSLIARARHAENPFPLFGGAVMCLLAVAVTHHVTCLLTAAFMVMWVFAERGEARTRVSFGALAAVSSAFAWAVVQHSLLQSYFAPVFADVESQLRGNVRRKAFEDPTGTSTPLFDQLFLLYYAGGLVLVALALVVLTVRWRRRREHDLDAWNPQLGVLVMAAAIPILFGARVVPRGGEFFDRLSSFLFFPLSFVVVNYMARLDWFHMARLPSRSPQNTTPKPDGRQRAVRLVAIVLASGMFLGGYVLGGGPDWARLPGPYLPAADPRSMDAETLAAVQWAAQELAPGSRIGADRVSSTLFASEAGLWPAMKGLGGVETPALYVAENWGQAETDLASALQLRYLYVDRRLADDRPAWGHYFFQGEVGGGKRLTDAQLTKFDGVPAIKLIYRHGPVSIYDLKGLGLPEYLSGWFGETPTMGLVEQLAVGLLIGLLLACAMRSQIWPRVIAAASDLRRSAGPALTAAIVLAGICVASIVLLLAHIWLLTPSVVVCATAAVVLSNPFKAASMAHRGAAKMSRRRVVTAILVAIPLAAIIAFSVLNAATEDVYRVRQILDDPSTVQISPNAPRK